MKKIVFSLALTAFAATNVLAQACVPDQICVAQGVGIYPGPDSMDIGTTANGLMSPLPCATVGVPYEFTFTAVVPTSYPINGINANISKVELTGITNRPPGIDYSCVPARVGNICTFPSSATVGRCVKLSGTPTAAGLFSMVVKTKIFTILTLNQDFPPSPGNPIQSIKGKYVLNVIQPGAVCPSLGFERVGCTVGVEARKQAGNLSAYVKPNPANANAMFVVGAKKYTTDAKLVIANAFGQVVYNDNITLEDIQNNIIDFDCSTLAGGVYYYTVEANGDRISERFVVQH